MTSRMCFRKCRIKKYVESDHLDSCLTWAIETLKFQVFPKEGELIYCGVACKVEALWTTWRVQGGLGLSGLCAYKSKVKWRSKAMILINQAKNNSLHVRNEQLLRHEWYRLTIYYLCWLNSPNNNILPYLVYIDNQKIVISWRTPNFKL